MIRRLSFLTVFIFFLSLASGALPYHPEYVFHCSSVESCSLGKTIGYKTGNLTGCSGCNSSTIRVRNYGENESLGVKVVEGEKIFENYELEMEGSVIIARSSEHHLSLQKNEFFHYYPKENYSRESLYEERTCYRTEVDETEDYYRVSWQVDASNWDCIPLPLGPGNSMLVDLKPPLAFLVLVSLTAGYFSRKG